MRFFTHHVRWAKERPKQTSFQLRMLPYQHILKDSHIVEKPDILKGTRNTTRYNLVGTYSSNRVPFQTNIARCRFIDTGNKIKNGGLAGTVWADDADNLFRVNYQVHILNGNQTSETFGYCAQFQESAACCTRSFWLTCMIYTHRFLFSLALELVNAYLGLKARRSRWHIQ